MATRLDPFVDVLLREGGDQLYLLPDEPVTIVKGGKPRKVSKQPLTDAHIYALLTEVAPSDAADKIDKRAETEFDYVADRGLVKVRIVPETGRLTAVISPARRPAAEPEPEPAPTPSVTAPAGQPRPAAAAAAAAPKPTGVKSAGPPPRPPRPSAIAAAPLIEAPVASAASEPLARSSGGLPAEFAEDQYQAAEKRLGELLKELVRSASSDLHLRVGEPPVFRTHGEITRQKGTALSADQLALTLLAIMPERNRGEWKETGDSDFAYEIEGLARFRVNAARDRKGPVAVFRVIPAKVVTVEEMGLGKEITQLAFLNKGLVLVSGPTGSGKSTTLCALIDLINRERTDHIITIEDPIEFVHENKRCLITQRQVHLHTDSFKTALRAALREDPDIVLVGEMRDLETIAIAIETAETGHLVFGTLHTTTAASTVDRIIDQFSADRQAQIRVMLSESLKGVISQTLCKKIGGGRVAAREVLLATPAVSNLIREGKTFQIPSIIQTSRKIGMITLNDCLLDLVEKKLIAPDEAYLKAIEKTMMLQALKARGHTVTMATAAST
ncbi:MAG TPA: type IV pilus twitching motility protein PilT [Gemmatimonadales bacterium]|nr:type IV pilus twitching motility protein PilT [Gemmatimonadales bacterium]